MNTVVKPQLNSKTFCSSKNYIFLKEKKISYLNIKFYQKLFVVFISLSTFLIIPESQENWKTYEGSTILEHYVMSGS